jgi:hypothetical protein
MGRFVDPAYVVSHGKQNITTLNELIDNGDIKIWRQWNTDVPRKQLAILKRGKGYAGHSLKEIDELPLPKKGKRLKISKEDMKLLKQEKVGVRGQQAFARAMKFDDDHGQDILEYIDLSPVEAKREIRKGRKRKAAFEAKGGDTKALHTNAQGVYSAKRRKLHDEIVNDMLKDIPKNQENPQALITGGYPGSDKSTMMKNPQYSGVKGNYVHLDSDEIKQALGKADGLKEVTVEAGSYHNESKDILKRVMMEATENKQNVLFDGTLKTYKSNLKYVDTFDNAGYEVELAFADLPLEKAVQRAVARFVGGKPKPGFGRKYGRLVDPTYVVSHGKDNIKALKQLVDEGRVTRWRIWNTDVPRGQLAELVDSHKGLRL